MREHKFNLTSIKLTAEKIAKYDLLLLATDHTKFDYELIQQHAKLIVDTRGIYLKPKITSLRRKINYIYLQNNY